MDAIDWKLIMQLQSDGRKTFKDLGEAIGFTSLGAKKRVDKLLGNGIIDISAMVNTDKLDLRLALILLEIENAEAMRKIIDRYSKCPRIINFFTTMGGFNLIALVMAEDQATLESECVEKCALRSGEGIRRSEIYLIGGIHHYPYMPLKADALRESADIAPCGVKCDGCQSFEDKKCVGCPALSYYRGPLKEAK
ncbi:MAG: Lrp/AsnC family transcriptional regulator [Candidatus Bathyarchaeota archaeon]|nr:Lrp/AsnC family transcriptional regulator [Candidatus Bathyarchaeum tardum]WGM88620.1 MAG: Lrp/AsnC family transcriptional regulator [Candidatus Bathyarchaeum tardum]